MFTFACIAAGLIVASTVLALLVPGGPEVTLSDIARQMEAMHRSQSATNHDVDCVETSVRLKYLGEVKKFGRGGEK
jgi:hypothetical protein